MLLVLALCLGLTSAGRLSGCLLPTLSADLAAAEVNPAATEFTPEDPGINPSDPEIISEDAEINPPAPQIIPSGPPTVSATGLIPLSPAGLSQGAGRPPPFLPAPAPVPVRAQEAGRRTSFFSSLPVSGGVSVGSFSSVGSFHGPQGGFHSAQGGFHGPQGSFHSPQGSFVQLSAPLVGLQVGYSGAHLSPPAVVCLNWCLDPTGNYFCCRYTGGQCPRVPDVCQTGSAVNRLPNCASDASCRFGFKCCFDRCQEQFVCQAAVAA
ncbi:hypothetical protein FJT64_017577 [Amphibalanus amphitrite]|uniref:WAP domain-containing protein n=1 Tax=Amphibalanus amphitrite TaxID=1232801 RepID=A0A6A4X0B0_AMPAM|nr:hypothetical protein FJT64_017577 [Amphibalanus amphitrite]